ncbi:hypothetical protein [Lentzea sp. HUAS12]|uniref:hypothetical protein n=1 Tax=Lentzea sp. HUAS12 TaxID=2951806 RepID=UPI0020A09776|nr:hypothetical protein [Lentzea sp. HUAS12]USX56350.1 hypothetical protein ND450_20285 [Lentzea sp. HUAS12]
MSKHTTRPAENSRLVHHSASQKFRKAYPMPSTTKARGAVSRLRLLSAAFAVMTTVMTVSSMPATADVSALDAMTLQPGAQGGLVVPGNEQKLSFYVECETNPAGQAARANVAWYQNGRLVANTAGRATPFRSSWSRPTSSVRLEFRATNAAGTVPIRCALYSA